MLKENPIGYLTPKDQAVITDWAGVITPAIERYPQFKNTDLIVEGGVGNGRILPHILRLLFPGALYVGTDIAPSLMSGVRLRQVIDAETLNKVKETYTHPSLDMQGAIIYGSCFDFPLIRSIQESTNTATPLLASFNSMFSLLARKMNLWDSKDISDQITVQDMVAPDSPYATQLHIGVDWSDGGQTSRSVSFFRLEEAAQQAGWVTERIDIGLALIRPS